MDSGKLGCCWLNKAREGDSLDLGNGWLRCIVKCDSLLKKGLQSKEDTDIKKLSIIIVLALCLAFIFLFSFDVGKVYAQKCSNAGAVGD